MAAVQTATAPEVSELEKNGAVELSGEIDESADVVAFANSSRFHRKLVFDSETTKSEVTVTFGTAGSESPDAPNILFVGGMYAGRWNAPWVDYLCSKKQVRGILIDRPGLGGTTSVEMSQRVSVWLEAVPRVLSQLGAAQVVLVAHSCGVIYAMNMLQKLPELVTNETPVYMLSPWVHPSKSGVKMLTVAGAMPTGVMKGLNKVTSFMVKSLMSDKPTKVAKSSGTLSAKDENMMATCGGTFKETEARRNYFIKRFFDENTTGCGEEFNMGLKDVVGNWGACEDYGVFVSKLAEQLRADNKRLCVRAVFAGKDGFIGKGGKKYFDEIWSDAAIKDVILYESEQIDGVEHDGPVMPENGVLDQVFHAAGAFHN